MEIGNKIVCVNLESDNPQIEENLEASFTIGKTYVVRFVVPVFSINKGSKKTRAISSNAIMVVDNLGKTRPIDSKHFMLLEDWRDKQIHKLGI